MNRAARMNLLWLAAFGAVAILFMLGAARLSACFDPPDSVTMETKR